MGALGKNLLVPAAIVATLGIGAIGGTIGLAQDGTPTACPTGSPVASPMAGADASPIAMASPVASPEACATPAAGGAATGQQVTVTSVDIAFNPEALTIPANTDVVVLLPNNGAAQHNFSIDALQISVDQAPGQTDQKVTINAPAGTYEYYCNVPGHKQAGMVGTLTAQ